MNDGFTAELSQKRSKTENENCEALTTGDNGINLNLTLTGGGRETYCIEVNTDLLGTLGICKGDLVLAERKPEAHNGNVVVARLGGEFVIRQMERQENKTRLTAAGKAAALDVTGMEWELWGVVTYVIRKIC